MAKNKKQSPIVAENRRVQKTVLDDEFKKMVADFLATQKKSVQYAEKAEAMKHTIYAFMTQHNITTFTIKGYTFSMKEGAVSHQFNFAKFKEDYPKLFERYNQEVQRKSYLQIIKPKEAPKEAPKSEPKEEPKEKS